jgi:5-methylcytosine-specific restriction endonuclease McrA
VSQRKQNRDDIRLATASDREEVYFLQDGLCFSCRSVLVSGETQFHHVKAWAIGGLTETSNLVALCTLCHKKEHVNV